MNSDKNVSTESLLKSISINPEATQDDAILSAKNIREKLMDYFNFRGHISFANAFGMMLSPLVLNMTHSDSRKMMFLVNANNHCNDRRLLCHMASIISTGEVLSEKVKGGDSFFRIKLPPILHQGRPIAIFEDLPSGKIFNDSSLSYCITTPVYRYRKRRTYSSVGVPVNTIFVVNGYNIRVGGEISRRSIWINLDEGDSGFGPRKDSRRGYSGMIEWCEKNRPEILKMFFTIVQAWENAGRPRNESNVVVSGFDEWCSLVGDILSYADVEGFLANYEKPIY